MFERAVAGLQGRASVIAGEQARAAPLKDELLRCEAPRRLSLVRMHRRFQRLTIASQLADESLALARSNPGRAQDLAELTLEIVRHLDRRRYGTGLLRDVQARAWAALGWGARSRAQVAPARAALETARTLAAEGSGDPLEQAQLWELAADLEMDRGHQEAGVAAIHRAAELYRQADHRPGLHRAMVREACWRNRCLDPDGGELLQQVLREIDPRSEPVLAGLAAFELVDLWGRDGRSFEARQWLAHYRQEWRAADWTHGLLFLLQGRLAEAANRTEAAAQGFFRATLCLHRRGQELASLRALLELARHAGNDLERRERWLERIAREATALGRSALEPSLLALCTELASEATAHSLAPELAQNLAERLERELDRGRLVPLAPF